MPYPYVSADRCRLSSMMLPYTVVLIVVWTAFYIAWYLLGIPWGPGAPVHS